MREQDLIDIVVRLIDLTTEAAQSSEPMSIGSLKELLAFLTAYNRRPAIFLNEQGNFRAVWRNAAHEQAAFQFRGDGSVHCVFMFNTETKQKIETSVDSVSNLSQKYPSFARLLNEPYSDSSQKLEDGDAGREKANC